MRRHNPIASKKRRTYRHQLADWESRRQLLGYEQGDIVVFTPQQSVKLPTLRTKEALVINQPESNQTGIVATELQGKVGYPRSNYFFPGDKEKKFNGSWVGRMQEVREGRFSVRERR